MKLQKYRLDVGGRINRTKRLTFKFNGKTYEGYAGDTLASALLANGVKIIGRSFKYHRVRGILSAGFEEPNALVQLESGARTEPNIQATCVELYDGLIAKSQNCWPSLNFDIYAINDKIKRLLPAGFYYKTFMSSQWAWMKFYEPAIRRAAGMGKSPTVADPHIYDHQYAHCDVLICGGGISGIAAALAAGRAGARVILVDTGSEFGGSLRSRHEKIDGLSTKDWVLNAINELESFEEVILLNRTFASSYYDHNMVVLDQRVADHKSYPDTYEPRRRLWQVRATKVILATGAAERPLVFANNDLPGVVLASAAQSYTNLYGIFLGEKAAVFTNNCSAYPVAVSLKRAGVQVPAIIDVRSEIPDSSSVMAKDAEIPVICASVVCRANGRKLLKSITIDKIDGDCVLLGHEQQIACDWLCVSGGWTPNVHLHSHAKGTLRYDEVLSAFVPDKAGQPNQSIGAANGTFDLTGCLKEGFKSGQLVVEAAGLFSNKFKLPKCTKSFEVHPKPLWAVPHCNNDRSPRFVDFQNDVKVEDIELSHREGFVSVEHLKRYTTLGMGTDQGRTSNINGLAIMAGLRNENIPTVGTTTFRPPFSPIPLNAIAGKERGRHFAPIRRTPMHEWHVKNGASFVPAGQWLRSQYYPDKKEKMWDAILREARNVRENVGIADVSPLGKIDLQGQDSVEFLNRLYINSFDTLPVGKSRYGVMLREDGHVFDDGTVTHINNNHFMITTTTVNAAAVLGHMEYWSQIEWPELDVRFMSVTDEWAGIAIAGPESRVLLKQVISGLDLQNESFPFMAFGNCQVSGVPARLFRISFSGELAYELNVPANYGLKIWDKLAKLGVDKNIMPYGMEAMSILRIEKGHVVGSELNGRTTPLDLGFGNMMSKKKDFLGKRALNREGMSGDNRGQLIGLYPQNKVSPIPGGAQIIERPTLSEKFSVIGEVTSAARSPNMGHPIGLGLVQNGRNRLGEIVSIASPVTGHSFDVVLCNPVFFDPEGKRLHD